jgi:hypothetical protein
MHSGMLLKQLMRINQRGSHRRIFRVQKELCFSDGPAHVPSPPSTPKHLTRHEIILRLQQPCCQ